MKWATVAMCLAVIAGEVRGAAPESAPPKKAPKAAKAPRPVPPKPTYSGKNPREMQPNAGTPDNTPPAGFVAAFNGNDLAGWKGLLKRPLDNPAKRAALSPEE